MPAYDICQPTVIRALEKRGWAIIGKPSRFYVGHNMPALIDLEAVKSNLQVFIEVKCFPHANRSQELHIAFGQYAIYREVLAVMRPSASLYLAVPYDNSDLLMPILQATIRNNRVKMIVVDLQKEEIVAWNE